MGKNATNSCGAWSCGKKQLGLGNKVRNGKWMVLFEESVWYNGKDQLELANCYSPEMNFLRLTDLRGLSLTQFQVLPHYNKFLSKFDKFEERCCAYEKEHSVNVIRINDGDGIFIDSEVYIYKA